jgi:threonine synthase
MKFISTRLNAPILNFEEVIFQGLATDSGLYVPEFIPQFDEKKLHELAKLSYQDLFFEITKIFVDNAIPQDQYKKIVEKSHKNFTHEAIAPIKQLSKNHYLLELFHGPTFAFKDFALQYLGNILDYFLTLRQQKIAIIGATSGDTGSAAIQGCLNCRNTKIFIMHPHNKVSEIQRKQMTTIIKDNVFNIAVNGNFDDCQNIVKQMFINQDFLKDHKMVAINSINFARIIAQIVYYFYSALRLGCNQKTPVSFSVPSGNFGDIYAGYLAKKMGLNINKLIIATNNNDILVRFINDNNYSKKPMIETISPSMNIQVASNFERLIYDQYKNFKLENHLPEIMQEFNRSGILKIDNIVHKSINKDFTAYKISDNETIDSIKKFYHETQEILDPHTAIGTLATLRFMQSENYVNEPVITLATAHPAKFPDAFKNIEIGEIKIPKTLQNINNSNENFTIINNNIEEIKNFISSKI